MATYSHDVDHGYAWIILVICVISQCFEYVATVGIYYMTILRKFQTGTYISGKEVVNFFLKERKWGIYI